jgi:DNA-binding XRE family transcriptional regulator
MAFSGSGLLRSWRKQNALTQVALAESLGVKQGVVSAWETGEFAPNLENAVRIERRTEGAVPVASWTSDAEQGAA